MSPISVPPPLVDPVAAQVLATRLDELARRLTAATRSDADRVGGATREWRGFTRTWFDRHHHLAVQELATASRLASAAAGEVRLRLAEQARTVALAEQAAAVEQARMIALVEAG